jgi:glycosyltransferase involved in cell wall biosynthesis|tara:strand:+ start:988 stop:2034 length:1047 start_codon:yes stop_codon:yes gene_type:complete
MKICHVNLARRFSGSERQTLLLITQQLRQGYKLTVVARNNSPFALEVGKLPCKLITTRSSLMSQSAKLHKQCDIVHAHERYAAQWAYMQNLRHGTSYVITHRTDKPVKDKYISLKAYTKAHTLVGLSNKTVSTLNKQFEDQCCVRIASSPVSYPVNQNKVDQIWSAHGHKPLVLQAGYVGKSKGFDVTIEAAKILEQNNIQVHVLLLGDGPETETLKKQAQGLENIFFMSHQKDMGTWFASANLLIQPSKSEGLSSVILEAIAAGLPVIASNTGGIPDIIEHEKTGLLIEPGNAKELASAIERIVSDAELRNRLQTEAKEKLSQFEISRTAQRYSDLYKQVATEKVSI